MDKNFINFHILISHSPSCLNRDDMNMQKSAIFGGRRRVRISSQSLKRTMRKSPYYEQYLGKASIRSRDLGLLREEFLKELRDEFPKNIVQEALERFVKTRETAEENDDDLPNVDTENKSGKKLAVAPWIKEEFKILCSIVREVQAAGLTPEEEAKANKDSEKQKKSKKGDKKSLEYFREKLLAEKIETKMEESKTALLAAIGSAKDVALAGRMATSGLMTTVEGALAVAHVITTHTVDADIDWFTAVDDLQEIGSGHLDTQEFSSGVFYRYASLNIGQLRENLGNVSREKALEVASHILHLMATVVPSAKQQSFAAHNLADLAMVSFADVPVSLANAFEDPVKAGFGGGFLKPSINAFHDYWKNVHTGYGLDEMCGEFVIGQVQPPDGMKRVKTLDELKVWVRGNGEG